MDIFFFLQVYCKIIFLTFCQFCIFGPANEVRNFKILISLFLDMLDTKKITIGLVVLKRELKM